MIHDLFAILGLTFICFLFWQQRRQSEIAKSIAARQCKQLDLQLISVAMQGHKLKTPEGSWHWHTVYQFEFSSLGDDCYQGEIVMQGFQLMKVKLPPHRM